MRTYDEDTLQQICDNVNLVEYVSQFMELKKRGENYYAHCPRHVDDTPSLSFNEEKNAYYCFSCQCRGGIIDYLRDFENLSFSDAVEKAASLANVDLSKMCQSNTVTFLKQVKAMQQKKPEPFIHQTYDWKTYHQYAKEYPQEWIDEGIQQDVMDIFDIRIDKKGNRIVYPVCDIDGKLINIKGRTRDKDYKSLHIPKYINYYPVGVMDYVQGLHITLPHVKERNEIILFESIKSVMKAYAWGYQNTASVEKHSITPEQTTLLANLKVNIIFAYDADVDYSDNNVRASIDKLRRITNVYIMNDPGELLGGKLSKNSPADCGKEIFEILYREKRKVTR